MSITEHPAPAPATSSITRAGWRSALFANVGTVRRRSGSDAVRLVVAVLAALLIALAWRSNPSAESWWVHTAVPPPTGLSWVFTGLFLLGTFGSALLLIGFALFARRRALAIDLGLAYLVGCGLSIGIQFIFGVSFGRPTDPNMPVNMGFPVVWVTAVVAMTIVGRPYLAHGVRRFVALAVGASILGAITTGRGLPLSLLASVALGAAAASIVRLVRGTPFASTRPDAVREAFARLGITAVAVNSEAGTGAARSNDWGVERLTVTDDTGVTYRVSAYGRDARDAELISSLWRLTITRASGVTPFIGRRQQAEHEALTLTRVADATAGASPSFVDISSTLDTGDVLVVARPAPGVALRERLASGPVSSHDLRAVVTMLHLAYEARLALVSIDMDNVLISDDGSASIDETLSTQLNAPAASLSRDVASTLVLAGLLSNADDAVALVTEVYGTSSLAAALPFLQRAALAPTLRADEKSHGTILNELRTAGAAAAGVEDVKLFPLHRVSGATLVLAIGTLIGGWALLGVFINVASSISTLKGAAWGWVALVALLAQLPYPSLATADLGSITGSQPLGRVILLEISNTFSGLAAGTPAVMAARIRFYQKMGYDATTAISSGALSSIVSWIVKGGMFVIALPFAWKYFEFSTTPTNSGSNGKMVTLILLFLLAIAVAVGVGLGVPRYRAAVKAKLVPKYHETKAHLSELAKQPRKLVEVFGGNAAAQIAVALALGAALHAFGQSLSLGMIIIVLTLGSMLGGVSPVPGGMGVVEAGMIIGLCAAGVPQPIAVSAVFVQRLFTAYLPPVYGYVILLWLRRHDYL